MRQPDHYFCGMPDCPHVPHPHKGHMCAGESMFKEPSEPVRHLQQATANTHKCIAALAAARNERQRCLADREISAETLSAASQRFRTLEAELGQLIEREMDAHIALLDYEIEHADQDSTHHTSEP